MAATYQMFHRVHDNLPLSEVATIFENNLVSQSRPTDYIEVVPLRKSQPIPEPRSITPLKAH